MFAAVLLSLSLLVVKVACADCGDYGTESMCLYKGQGADLVCLYDSTQSWIACTDAFCTDLKANKNQCEQSGIDCVWNASDNTCHAPFMNDCDYYDGLGEAVCTANNGRMNCQYGGGLCTNKGCVDYSGESDCNAQDGCKWDATCKDIYCSNYSSAGTAAGCQDNDKGLSCYWDGSSCTTGSCGKFSSSSEACVANNGKLDCAWDDTLTTKCQSNQCKYYGKDNCSTNNGKMDCEWLSSTSVCNRFTCASYSYGLLDNKIISEAGCLTDHPTCQWDGKKCTAGAISVGIPSLIILLMLLLSFSLQ